MPNEKKISARKGLSHTAFAKEVGLTRGRVSQLVAEGLPTLPTGRIDPEEGQAWLSDWLDPKRREAAKEGSGAASQGGTVARLRAESLSRDLRLKDVAVKRAEGSVIDRDETEAAIFARARFERDAWVGWAARTAALMAAELGADPERAFAFLDKETRTHLDDLSRTPLEFEA